MIGAEGGRTKGAPVNGMLVIGVDGALDGVPLNMAFEI